VAGDVFGSAAAIQLELTQTKPVSAHTTLQNP
jgi:hypothetical protein